MFWFGIFLVIIVFFILRSSSVPSLLEPLSDERFNLSSSSMYIRSFDTLEIFSSNDGSSIWLDVVGKPSWMTVTIPDPHIVGVFELAPDEHMYHIELDGDFVFVSMGNRNIRVYNIQNRENPKYVNQIYTPYSTSFGDLYLDRSENILYGVGTGYGSDPGVYMFDVSDPVNDVLNGVFLSNKTENDSPQRSCESEGFLYITDQYFDSLTIVNVSNMSNPNEVHRIDLGNRYYPDDVVVREGICYITALRGLMIFDVRNKLQPLNISHSSTLCCPGSLAIVEEEGFLFAFVTTVNCYNCQGECVNCGLEIHNISDPYNPYLIGYVVNGDFDGVVDVVVEGNYAFLCDGDSGYKIVDISNKSSPFVAYIPVDKEEFYISKGIEVQENFIFISDDYGGLKISKFGDLQISGSPQGSLFCGNQTIRIESSDSSGKLVEEFTIMFTDACSEHGVCNHEHNNCTCFSDSYYDPDCGTWKCGELERSSDGVCNGKGVCVDHENCSCVPFYSGEYCQYFSCFNISSLSDNVCFGHGSCEKEDMCRCRSGYGSKFMNGPCTEWFCSEYSSESVDACNRRGRCVSSHQCDCEYGYEGNLCETWSCDYDKNDELRVCSGRGRCKSGSFSCECRTGFSGKHCGTNLLLYTVMTPILVLCGLLFACCLLVCCCITIILFYFGFGVLMFSLVWCSVVVIRQKTSLQTFGKLRDFNLLLREQELDDSVEIAHLRINTSLFKIPFDEISTVSILGEGGSNSVVFKAIWSGRTVAFKCFKTRLLCQDQDKFDEFEREVEILGSISHPNIIRFFGATMEIPRIGIVMEFCQNGEILQYLVRFKEMSGSSYPLFQKLRMLRQVALALGFLHSRNIIHRDVKSENILIDSNENTKLMDFGLSKLVQRMSEVKTSRIGTNLYMAPEIIFSRRYTEKCDVFSFAILFFIIITENDSPYEDSYQVEFKVANDRDYRPNIKKLVDKLELYEYNNKNSQSKSNEWLINLITKCWEHEPKERFSFKEISAILKEKSMHFTAGSDSHGEDEVEVRKKEDGEFNENDEVDAGVDESNYEEMSKEELISLLKEIRRKN